MVITDKVHIPTEEELTVQEINLTFPVLQAAAFHLGKYCEHQNNEFMLCKFEEKDPARCINEGKLVTACALEFFKKIKKHCQEEFKQYHKCIDYSSSDSAFAPCRKTQGVFDKCVLDNLNIERPAFGYFCEVKVHDSARPKPKAGEIPTYEDAAVPLSPDEPRLPAKYGSRKMWNWS